MLAGVAVPCQKTSALLGRSADDKVARRVRRLQADDALLAEADASKAAVVHGHAVQFRGIGLGAQLHRALLLVEAAATHAHAVHGEKPLRWLTGRRGGGIVVRRDRSQGRHG